MDFDLPEEMSRRMLLSYASWHTARHDDEVINRHHYPSVIPGGCLNGTGLLVKWEAR